MKNKKHKCKHCGKDYPKFNSTQKYCNYSCGAEAEKTRAKKKTTDKAKRKIQADKVYVESCKKIVDRMIEAYGYIYCDHCKRSRSKRYEIHHIVYRSERSGHEHMHDKSNLIHLCFKCHNEAHSDKHKWRAKYIKERELIKLFGNDILPLNNNN